MNPISPDPTAPPANRRPLLLAGAGAVGVLLGLVVLVTLTGSEGPAPSASPPATVVPEPEQPEPPTGVDPELAFSVARDPFEQLVTPAEPEAATGPMAVEVPVPAEVPLPAPVPPAGTETPPPPGAGAADTAAPHPPAPAPAPEDDPPTPGIWYFPASAPPPSQQPPPQESAPDEPLHAEPPPEVLNDPEQLMRWMFEHMRLWSVLTDDAGTPRAFITIDDHAYLPAEGQVFGEHFRVERIDADCVEVSAPNLHPGICVPTPAEAGDATAEQPTAAQACVVARPPSDDRSPGRSRLGLTPCDRVPPATRLPV